MGWGGVRFQGDASTEGSRCLLLSNVHDDSVVTPCRVVKKRNYFQWTVHRIIWQ